MQCARERLYLNSKHSLVHYRDIHLYTYRPRGYYFTGDCLCNDLGQRLLRESLPPCYKKAET